MTDTVTIAGQNFIAHGWAMNTPAGSSYGVLETIIEGMSPVIVPNVELVVQKRKFSIQEVNIRTRADGKKMTTISALEVHPAPVTIRGQHPRLMVLDEVESFNTAATGSMEVDVDNITIEKMRVMLGEPLLEPGRFELEALRQEMLQRPAQDDPPALPPCATYRGLDMLPKAGDEIVITEGEQRGWRGRVANSYTRQPTTIECHMTKPDGTRSGGGVPVSQQARFVAKVLPPVPAFGGQDDADAWLTANDREIRPMYVVGQRVRFTYAHRVKRASLELDGRVMKVIEDLELTGKVVAFAPHGPITASQAASAALNSGDGPVMAGPQYKVLTLDLPAHPGTPRIVWVPAALMLG